MAAGPVKTAKGKIRLKITSIRNPRPTKLADMDATYETLAQRIQHKWAEAKSAGRKRLLVALAGPPGSGKTTVAQRVAEHLATLHGSPSISVISADGFHLPLATLRALPDAATALARRGAPWTFDASAVVDLVRKLRDEAGKGKVMAPSFDHSVKDPVADSVVVGPEVEVCLLEGNYLLSDEAPWDAIAGIVDDRWLVRVDRDLARKRVAARHLAAGIENSMERAVQRAEENDMVNGDYVAKHSDGRYDLVIESVEESRLS